MLIMVKIQDGRQYHDEKYNKLIFTQISSLIGIFLQKTFIWTFLIHFHEVLALYVEKNEKKKSWKI